MVLSQNGWSANDISQTTTYTIGNGRSIRLRRGDAGYLLTRFANWFDKNIEDIDAGQLDDWGYAERNIRGSETTVSNHASGTAMDLNATKHPLGVRGTFPKAKAAAIREHLKVVYGDVIRWGGDYVNRADEMHFEINGTAADVARVATHLRTVDAAPKPPAPKELTVAERAQTLASHIVNGINEDRSIDLDDLDRLIALGHQPEATAAKTFRDAIIAGYRAFNKAVD